MTYRHWATAHTVLCLCVAWQKANWPPALSMKCLMHGITAED